ncbi:MAG: DUF559 domain-containing protein [Candidatus Bathyarchaeia archaeon]
MITSGRKRQLKISKTEDKLAAELNKRKVNYKRQVRIGRYVVDFLIPPSIVVDVEGPYHNEVPRVWRDEKRKAYLEKRNYQVYEFSAGEVYCNPWKYAELIATESKKLKEQTPQK